MAETGEVSCGKFDAAQRLQPGLHKSNSVELAMIQIRQNVQCCIYASGRLNSGIRGTDHGLIDRNVVAVRSYVPCGI